MDWDLSLNSGKQSVWWSLSQSVCYFRHLPIYCHSSDWQFLNLDFFAWYEVFFFFFYIIGTSTALICTHSCHVGNIQKYASTKLEIKVLESLLGGGVSEIHKCSSKWTVLYWLMWAFPLKVRRTVPVRPESPIQYSFESPYMKAFALKITHVFQGK